MIVNLSASDETTGKDAYRRKLVSGQSARLICGYVYATAGNGESTQDLVFGGQNLIAENGTVLREAKRFANETIYGEIDVERLESERRRISTWQPESKEEHTQINFHVKVEQTPLSRFFDPSPLYRKIKRTGTEDVMRFSPYRLWA